MWTKSGREGLALTESDLEAWIRYASLCREAQEFHFATVCVNPTWVATCAQMLRHHGVGVCTVVGFPLGATTSDVKAYETRRVIFDGATEPHLAGIVSDPSPRVTCRSADVAAVAWALSLIHISEPTRPY